MRGRAGRGRKSAPSTVTIPVQATSTGAISANQFTGWTHSSGEIFSRNAWGVNTKYFRSSVKFPIDIRSKAVSRDQALTFWASNCEVYLRLTDDGLALRFVSNVDAGGGWSVAFVQTNSVTFDDVIYGLGSGTPSGINTSDTDGDTYTFGVEGFDVYVSWNGVEQWRTKQIFHHRPGRIALRSTDPTGEAVYGYRHVSAEFKASVPLYSTPEFNVLDVRDFGFKQLTATGSMTAASTTLTLTSNPGFAIGDKIVVEIGGEIGTLGLVGSVGVGGQWPTLTYANAAARNADTSQATDKLCALIDTGIVFRWTGSAWTQFATTGYHYRMLPRSLMATITNVSGTTITLDTAATVSTTGATVYFNNHELLDDVLNKTYNLTTSGFPPETYIEDKTIHFAEGDWWFAADNAIISFASNRTGWTWTGVDRDTTTLNNPKGTTSARFQISTCPNGSIRDLAVRTNRRWDSGWFPLYSTPAGTPAQDWIPEFRVTSSDNFSRLRTKAINASASYSFCTNSYFDDTELVEEQGMLGYFAGWAINMANCTDCYATNTTYDSPTVANAAEIFQGDGCYYDGLTVTNGTMAINSSASWQVRNLTLTLETGAADDSRTAWISTGAAVFDINSNISGQQGSLEGSQNGIFEDFTLVQESNVKSGYVFPMVGISGEVDYITIRGQYPDKPNTKGLIQLPTYAGGSDTRALGDNDATRESIIIDGVRILGANTTGPDIKMSSANAIVRNCVADTITNAGTSTSNITNAAYNAL